MLLLSTGAAAPDVGAGSVEAAAGAADTGQTAGTDQQEDSNTREQPAPPGQASRRAVFPSIRTVRTPDRFR